MTDEGGLITEYVVPAHEYKRLVAAAAKGARRRNALRRLQRSHDSAWKLLVARDAEVREWRRMYWDATNPEKSHSKRMNRFYKWLREVKS